MGELIARLIAATAFAVVIVDADGRIASWNAGAEATYGFKQEQILGQPYEALYPEEARKERHPKLDLRLASIKGRAALEQKRLRSDGSTFHARIELLALKRDTHLVDGYGEIAEDVTAARESTGRVREEAQSLRRLVEHSVEAVLSFDEHGRVVHANAAAERLFERRREGLIDRRFDDPAWGLVSGEEPGVSGTSFCYLRTFRTGEVVAGARAVRVRAGAEPQLLEMNAGPMRDAWRRVSGVLVTVRDVTRTLRKAEDRRSRAEALRLLRREAETQEAERSRIARELHDEIGSALTGIGFLLTAVHPPAPEHQAVLDEARGLLPALARKVRGICRALYPAPLQTGGLLPALRELVGTLSSSAAPTIRFRESGLRRRFEPAVELGAYRIFQEALTNAIRHSGASEIATQAWFGRGTLHLVVEDNGPTSDLSDPSLWSGGLAGMRSRALLLGGRLEVVPGAAGRGLRVQAELPAGEGTATRDVHPDPARG